MNTTLRSFVSVTRGKISKFKRACLVLTAVSLIVGGFFVVNFALADGGVSITPATGGEAVLIDTTSQGGTGIYTDLSGPGMAEISAGSIAAGTHTISLPAGWEFDTASHISVIKFGGNIVLAAGSNNITPLATSFSFVINTPSTLVSTLGFANLRVRPTTQHLDTSVGDITHSGAAISDVTDGVTSFGNLTTIAGVPNQLSIETQANGSGMSINAGDLASGSALTAYAIERDQFNNFSGNVAAAWSLTNKSGGVIDGNLVASEDNKSAVLTGNIIGTATIHAIANSRTANSGVITVIPGPVSAGHSTVEVSPSEAVVSSPGVTANNITVTITATDAAGNAIIGKTASISATGTDNTISPASISTDSSGVAVFTISSTKAEAKTITATVDSVTITSSTPGVTFTHDVASQLSITQQPSTTATAGTAFAQQPIVNVLDQFGNLVTNSVAVITAARNVGTDVLKGTADPVTATAIGGVATFSGVKYEVAETITISFTSGILTLATSGSVNVSADIIDSFTLSADISQVAGIPFSVSVSGAVDQYENPASGSVTVSALTGGGNSPNASTPTYGTITVTNGSGSANTTLVKTIDTVLRGTVGGITADTGTIAVSPNVPATVTFTQQPASTDTVDNILITQPVVRVVDAYGNNVTDGTSVTLTRTGGAGALRGTQTVTTTGGTATFTDIGYNKTDAFTITATAGGASAISNSVGPLSAGVSTQVVLTAVPGTINASTDVAKAPISSVITGQLKDQYGNISTTAGVSVVITTDKGAVTETTVTDANGQVISTLTSGGDETAGVAHIGATTAKTVIPTTVTFVDVTAPNAPVITAPTEITYTNAASYTITGTAEANSLVQVYRGTVVASQQLSGGATSFSISTPLVLNSANNFTITAKDAAGNESLPTTVATIDEDNVNPSVTSYTLDNPVISPNYSAGVQDIATFNVAFSEEVTATMDIVNSSDTLVKHIYGPTIVTNPGAKTWDGKNTAGDYVANEVYTIKIIITDKALNSITDTTKTITVDNTAPTVALTYSANPAKAGAMTVTATYSESIVGTPQISIDQQGDTDITTQAMSGGATVWTYPYTVVTDNGVAYKDGVATVGLSTIADAAGNNAALPSGTTFTIDTVAPTASITSPTADAVVKNADGYVSLVFDATGGSTCEYTLDAGVSYNSLANCDFPKQITLADGRNSIILRVTDTAGNPTLSSVVSFVVDTNDNLTVAASGADFTTIQAAIDAATEGDTINVSDDRIYAESVVIDKGLILQATAGATIAPAAGPGVQIEVSPVDYPVTVDGFTITPLSNTEDTAQGIVIGSVASPVATHNITISNNTITTVGVNMGILVRGVGSNGPGYPNSSDLTVTHNTITLSGDSTAFYASWVTPAHSNWSITYNTFNSPIGVNLQLHDVDGVTVDHNIFEQAGSGGSTSVFFVAELSNLTSLATFSNNDVRGSGANLVSFRTDMNTASVLNTMANVTVTGNTFDHWVVSSERQALGIYPRVTNVTVHQNKFTFIGGSTALRNTSGVQVDASQNWWGDISGPTHATLNLHGTGDAISDNVSFVPWYPVLNGDGSFPVLDSTAPTAELTGTPANPTKLATANITVGGTGIVYYKYNLDSAGYGAETAIASNISLSGLSSGSHTLLIIGRDQSGNWQAEGGSATSYTWTVDTGIPTLSTVTIASNNANDTTLATTGNTVTITIVANENIQVPTATIAGHSATITTGSDAQHWTASYQMVSGDTTGTIVFSISFTDIAGNNGTAVTAVTSGSNVTFDKTAPTVNITAPLSAVKVNSADIITFSDNELTAAKCSIDNSIWVACESGATTLGNVTGFDALGEGSFTLYLKDTDPAGNIGTDSETGIIKDSTAPTITASSLTPSDNAVGISPTSPTISATFNETIVAGNSDVEVRVDNGATVTATVSFDDSTKKLTITPSTSLASNTKYQVTIKTSVADTAGNPLAEAKVWHFTTSAAYSIALTTGWNLISLPVVPSNSTAIADVLGATADSINAVWTYDASTSKWSVYRPDGSGAEPGTDDLTTMTAGYGYWVDYKTGASSLSITGTGNLIQPGNNNIPERTLKAGWNLVGYYQRENTSNSTSHNAFKNNLDGYWNETLLIGHNNTSKNTSYLTQTSTVNPGEGFWILLTDDRIYTIGDVPTE